MPFVSGEVETRYATLLYRPPGLPGHTDVITRWRSASETLGRRGNRRLRAWNRPFEL